MPEYIDKLSVVNRLIDIENEFQQYKPFHGFEHAMYRKLCEAEIEIGKTQSADVAPVRHGRWVDGHCSECGAEATFTAWTEPIYDYDWEENLYYSHDEIHNEYHETNYCPNCGATMDLN